MSLRKHIFGVGLLVAAATSVPAYAQSTASTSTPNVSADFPVCTKTTPSSSESEIAKQKFIAARQDYEEGSYDSALRRFKDAYANDCTKPEVLLIVSATYEKKGDRPSALAALETYVARAGKDAPDLATTQTKIENLKKQIASQPPPPPPTATATQQPQGEQQEHTVFPWIVAGVGAAAVIVGVIVFASAPAFPSNCSTDGPKDNCNAKLADGTIHNPQQLDADQAQAGSHVNDQRLGAGFMIGGGVLLVGGLVWHFLEPTGPKSSARLLPTVSPGYGGLSFDTKF